MKKRITIIGIILVIVLVVISLIGTLATDATIANNDSTYQITLTGSTGEITVPAGESKTVMYQITSTNKGTVKYGVAYSGTDITVKVYKDTIDPVTGLIDYGENKFVKLYIENSGTSSSTAFIKAILGYENGGELDTIVPTGYTLVTEEYEPPVPLQGAALYITNLYLNNKDATLVERDGISYRYASSVRLMNDRQASMDVEEDVGNIRYYGKDDTTVSDDLKNYVYFNCSDYSNQSSSTCELWRIIGVFDGKVKIARNNILTDSSGSNVNLAWDQDKNINSSVTTYSNNWKESSLQLMLNSSYYNGDTAGEITYYSGSDGTTTATLNMSSIGIKNDTTRELISLSTWYLGGYSSPSGLYANDIYIHERSGLTGTIYGDNPPTTEANIGLMYASDYSYTADLSVCSKDIYNYDTDATNCAGTAWLLQSNGTNTNQWLINPRSSSSDTAWNVNSSGRVNYIIVIPPLGVRPVLYLDSTVDFGSGDGTQNTPFQISVG